MAVTLPNSKPWYERLQAVLDEKGITQAMLVKMTGISKSTIFQLLNGTIKDPKISNLLKIFEVIGVDPYLIMTGKESQPVTTNNETKEDDYVVIPSYAISAGCGTEAEPTWEESHDIKPVIFPRELFVRLGVDPESCKCVEASGVSMVPTINDGDTLLVDCTQIESTNQIVDGGIYVFFDTWSGLRVKRLYHKGKGLKVVSDNPTLDPEELSEDDLQHVYISGRVVYKQSIIK